MPTAVISNIVDNFIARYLEVSAQNRIFTRDTGHGTRDTGHGTRDTGHGTRDTGHGTRDKKSFRR